MAALNIVYLRGLISNIDKGEDILPSLHRMSIMPLALEEAEKLQIVEKLRKLMPYRPMTEPCRKIIENINLAKENAMKKQAQKERRNLKRKENYHKRKAENVVQEESKKAKMSPILDDEKENSAETKKMSIEEKKTKVEFKKRKPTKMMMKCMRQAQRAGYAFRK